MAVWKFKRGEWREAYVFMRLLGDRIYNASADLQKDDSTYIDIINIIRDEPDRMLIFERFIEDNTAYVKTSEDGEVIRIVTIPEIYGYARALYDSIKSLNAQLDHSKATEGFSIKSHIGSSATLFNSSQTSGFTFEVLNCNELGMHRLNSLDAFLSIMSAIKSQYALGYVGCRNEIFEQNIAIVDSRMDEVLSTAVLVQAGYFGENTSSDIKDVCDEVININPIGVNNPTLFYPAKFKDFLFSSFAGMTASSLYNGRKQLTGGYIDVSREGEILYYRAMSDNIFGSYLYEHTYFDRPDRGVNKDLAVEKAKAFLGKRTLSEAEINGLMFRNGKKRSKKGDCGYVYTKDGRYFIDLNFRLSRRSPWLK